MRGKVYLATAFALLAAVAANGAVRKKTAAHSDEASIAKTLDCTKHRFEATIHLSGPDGKIQDKTVRMCGVKGESDAEWLTTLKDAVKKTAASSTMPQGAKDQIIAAVNAEVARLSMPSLNLPEGGDIANLPKAARSNTPEAPISRDYNALPPLPTASTVAPPHVLGPEGAIAETAHVTLRCARADDVDRPDQCDSIDKDTILVLRADQPYPRGLALSFVRHGNARAKVELPVMRAGETKTLPVPPAVCTGVVRSKLEIDAVDAGAQNGAVPGEVGVFDLRC